jgi:hypothetical protein
MSTFLFTYRYPKDLQTGTDVGAWQVFLDGLDSNLVDAGNPVFGRSTVGFCPSDTVLGGYSIVRADNIKAAIDLAEGCPALMAGGCVEVGELTLLNPASINTTSGDHAVATQTGS